MTTSQKNTSISSAKPSQEIIAEFLVRTGQWLTNEATHQAALAQAWNEALEAAIQLIWNRSNIVNVMLFQALAEDLRKLKAQPSAPAPKSAETAKPTYQVQFKHGHPHQWFDVDEMQYTYHGLNPERMARRIVYAAPVALVDRGNTIEARALNLIQDATIFGKMVRIDLVPLKPLAMGNLDMVVDVRPARKQEEQA